MKTYTVGFVFDTTLEQVLLVHKQKPEFQAGFLNGMGGKIEDGETAVQCMTRECTEETALVIPESDWMQFATIKDTNGMNPKAEIYVYAAIYQGAMADAHKNDYEEIEWFPHQPLPDNALPNVRFLVPMAREKLRGHDLKEVIIRH